MAEGYIRLYRKLTAHFLWQDKPFSKGQAWIDLLFMANHTDTCFFLGDTLVTAEAGQVVTSEMKLANRWGWSRQKVRSFLAVLVTENMIVKAPSRNRTVLTLCNYSTFNETSARKNSTGKRKKNAAEQIPPLFSPLEAAIEEFRAFRAKIKKPMTDKALDLLQLRLQKLAGDDVPLKVAILEQSILRGWAGVFELKDCAAQTLDYR